MEVQGVDGEHDTDMALIDAVAVNDPYVGSLELFDPETMMIGVFTRADPAAMGFSGLAGTALPCAPGEERGVVLEFTPPSRHPARWCVREHGRARSRYAWETWALEY